MNILVKHHATRQQVEACPPASIHSDPIYLNNHAIYNHTIISPFEQTRYRLEGQYSSPLLLTRPQATQPAQPAQTAQATQHASQSARPTSPAADLSTTGSRPQTPGVGDK